MGLIPDYKKPSTPNPFSPVVDALIGAPEGSAWSELVNKDSKLSVSTTKQKIQAAAREKGFSARFQAENVTDTGTELVFLLGAKRSAKGEAAEVEPAPEGAGEDTPAKGGK